jgi:hypothetical protein
LCFPLLAICLFMSTKSDRRGSAGNDRKPIHQMLLHL